MLSDLCIQSYSWKQPVFNFIGQALIREPSLLEMISWDVFAAVRRGAPPHDGSESHGANLISSFLLDR